MRLVTHKLTADTDRKAETNIQISNAQHSKYSLLNSLMSPIDLWKETPLIFSEILSSTLKVSVYLKLEVRPVRISKRRPD